MARRLPSPPPVIPGFSHLHVLGSGGFADVFLYEQNMPRRQVAVKVLLSAVVTDEVRQMFQDEANLMAQLSAHPSILTVYQASVSSDGRPYIVMELCSSALGARYRSQPLPVSEALRIAILIGSAVETAHRAGVLHRDIKPGNILLTAYGHPVLSDFGIAATLTGLDDRESVGLSIPWSAPEVLLDETPGTVRSEVWSLAATVFSFLAGRSPFEIPGGPNSPADLTARICRGRPQPIGRTDVPASLENLLGAALSRKPDHRPDSVLDLITDFQSIEIELGVSQTPIEVAMDEWALATVSDPDDPTVRRGVAGALPAAPGGRRRRRAIAPAFGSPARTSPWAGHRVAWILAGCGIVVVALGIATALVVSAVSGASDRAIPVVANITAVAANGTVDFSWQDPGITSEDAYSISTGGGSASVQRSSAFTVATQPGERVCITVTVTREGTTGSPSGEKCVDVTP
jgi:hypothetical protein